MNTKEFLLFWLYLVPWRVAEYYIEPAVLEHIGELQRPVEVRVCP